MTNVENNLLNAVRVYLETAPPRTDLALGVIEQMPDGASKNTARSLLSKHFLENNAPGKALDIALQMTAGEEMNVALAGYICQRLDVRDGAVAANMYQYLAMMTPSATKDDVIQKFTEGAYRVCDVDKVVAAILMVSAPEQRVAWQERYFQNALLANCPVHATKMLATLGHKPRHHECVKLLAMVLEHGCFADFELACALCDRSHPTHDELGILAEKASERLELNHALAAIKKMLPGPIRTGACWKMVNAFSQLDYGQLEFINAELEVVLLMLDEERGQAYAVLMDKCLGMGMVAMGSRVASARGQKFTDAEIEKFIAVNHERNNRYGDGDIGWVKEMKDRVRRLALAKLLLAFFIECGEITNAQAVAEICKEVLTDEHILAMIRKCRYNLTWVTLGLSLLKKQLTPVEMEDLLLGTAPAP